MRSAYRLCFACGSLWLVVCLALAGCQLSMGATPATLPATQAPRFTPTATVYIASSDELYRGDTRAIGETNSSLASFPAGAILPPAYSGESERAVSVLLAAGESIRGELYATAGPRRAGLLLLGRGNEAWGAFPLTLSQAGFVALVLQTNAKTQARQVETMLLSLIAHPSVDAGRVAVVGVGAGAELALLGCAANTLCDVLALLGPPAQASMLNVLPSYGARPLWLAASQDDGAALQQAKALAETAQGQTRFVQVRAGQGASMLEHRDLADDLINWLRLNLNTEADQ